LTNKEICKDYTKDMVWVKGVQKTICAYWDFDNTGLCKHDSREVCLVYLNKKGITNPWLIDFMDEFGCKLQEIK